MGLFFGTVVRYDSIECKYEIQYDDGDFVKMTELEVLSSLMEEEENISASRENAVLPLSDRTNRMDNNNNISTMTIMKHVMENDLMNDDETNTLVKGQGTTTLIPPPQLSLPVVPPPSLPPSKTIRRSDSSKDEALEKEENDRMMQNMTTSTRSNLAELRPDGRWERNGSHVPMAEVVGEDSSSSRNNNHRNRRRHRQRDQMMAGEACVCKISGCVVM